MSLTMLPSAAWSDPCRGVVELVQAENGSPFSQLAYIAPPCRFSFLCFHFIVTECVSVWGGGGWVILQLG